MQNTDEIKEILNHVAESGNSIRWAAEDLRNEQDKLVEAMFRCALYSHCDLYLDLLEAAGKKATEYKKEVWLARNKHNIVDTCEIS
jgi:hypothetical protein